MSTRSLTTDVRGIRTSVHDPVFIPSVIERLKVDSQSVIERDGLYPSPIAFVGVDPNGYGSSDYAMVTTIPWHGEMVVRLLRSSISVVLLRTSLCCEVE